MTYAIKSSLVADIAWLVLVDDDGTTIKDLVSGNTISLDSGVAASVATGAWKSMTNPKYFVTTDPGSFGMNGVRWTGTRPTINQTDADGMAAGFCCHGASNCSAFGNSFVEISSSEGNPAGLQRISNSNAKGRLTGIVGGTFAISATDLPTDGTTKFTFGGNYRSGVSSEVFYGLESGALASDGTAGDDGGWGGTHTAFAIGGDPGQGAQPFKPYIVFGVKRFLTPTEWQSIHTDWKAFFLDLGPQPAVTNTSSATPSVGASLTITGTTFGASQGSGSVTIGGVTQTVTAWSDTSITITVVRGTNKFGAALNVIVTDNALVSSSPYALTSLQPAAGWAFVDLTTPNTVAANRLQTSPDLASGDQIAYESLSGAVSVASDATFTVANSVTAFQFEAWTPADGWGTMATQQVIPPWYAPASADTRELAAKLNEFRALLNPQSWFGPVAVEKWFADEMTPTVGGPAEIIGTLNATLGAVTLSAAATVPHTAALNATLGAVTLSAAATVPHAATLNAALDAVTLSAAATVPHTATLNTTLGAVTVSGAATVPHTGDLNAALGPVTLSASGALGSGINGALTVTLGAVTSSGAAAVAISGSATPALGAVTLSGSGTLGSGINGSLSATLGAVTASAAAAAAIGGTLNAALAPVTLSAAGVAPHVANLNVTLGAVTLSATGGALGAIVGTLNSTLDPLTLSAAAQALISGNLSVTLGPVTSVIADKKGYLTVFDAALAGMRLADASMARLTLSDQ